MFATFNIRHICNAARRFVGANDGNIAVIFTIAAIPVIGFVGAAIDYSRTNSARSSVAIDRSHRYRSSRLVPEIVSSS